MGEGVGEEESAVAAEAWVAGSRAPENSVGYRSLSGVGGAGVLERARNLLKAVPAAAMERVEEEEAAAAAAVAAEECGQARYQAAAGVAAGEEAEKESLPQHRLYSWKPQAAVVMYAAAAAGVAVAGVHSSVSPPQEEAGVLLHRWEASAVKAVRAVAPLVVEAEEGGTTGNSRGASSVQMGRCSAVLREAADRGAGAVCPKERLLLHAFLLQTSSESSRGSTRWGGGAYSNDLLVK